MLHNVYYNGEMISAKRYKRIKTGKAIKNVLLFVLFIMLLGIIGHFDMQNEISTTEYDRQNKQEVIKDLQLRCYTGDLQDDFCKGL